MSGCGLIHGSTICNPKIYAWKFCSNFVFMNFWIIAFSFEFASVHKKSNSPQLLWTIENSLILLVIDTKLDTLPSDITLCHMEPPFRAKVYHLHKPVGTSNNKTYKVVHAPRIAIFFLRFRTLRYKQAFHGHFFYGIRQLNFSGLWLACGCKKRCQNMCKVDGS